MYMSGMEVLVLSGFKWWIKFSCVLAFETIAVIILDGDSLV